MYDSDGSRPKSGRRRAVKGKTAARASGSKRTAVMAALLVLLVAVAVGSKVLPSLFSQPVTTIPDELVGVWNTKTPQYADRSFEISKTSVLFRTGTGDGEFTFHEILEVERDQVQRGIEYTLVYTDDLRFSFIYETAEGVIRFSNQTEFFWSKRDATPTTLAAIPDTPVEAESSADSGSDAAISLPAPSPGTELPPREETQLIREVFSYRGASRDPFKSLFQSDNIRPFLQDLRITGITYDPSYPSRSVAVLRDTVSNKAYPVRVGAEVGRMRVAEISPGQVVLIVSEFGTERQVELRQRGRRAL